MWLPGLFNPQAFLTAVMQTTARRNDWALDRTVIVTEVTKRLTPEQIDAPACEGAYVHGGLLWGWGVLGWRYCCGGAVVVGRCLEWRAAATNIQGCTRRHACSSRGLNPDAACGVGMATG